MTTTYTDSYGAVFPSPDGELVGLDPIPLETLQYGVFKVRSRETT
ncbi:hypothetical protein AmaxDRAFT_5643 [Limnospira maxima CS-328]|uniref:Uncharacterized protein n=1 Tax=Limnospira maxima CS-328 TaxID=513049 RepID=B5WA43_LIMMA|nr:hypothetical protein AmaxDRAFT_5643 [Limnospira maxima CS-328]